MLIVDGSVLSALVLGVTTLVVAAIVTVIYGETGLGLIGIAVALPLPLIVVYITLSAIEMMGLRLMAWKHRWREGGYGAKLVVANAAVAWSVASVLVPIGVALGTLAGEMFARVGVVAGFLIGLLAFETLVYIGMQRMKYANPPGSERELAPDRDSSAVWRPRLGRRRRGTPGCLPFDRQRGPFRRRLAAPGVQDEPQQAADKPRGSSGCQSGNDPELPVVEGESHAGAHRRERRGRREDSEQDTQRGGIRE
jgi:hypothetical protein